MGLALLDDERTVAFNGFVSILARNNDLKRIGMVFRTWSGDTTDADEPAEAELPWCRLTPMTQPSTWSPTMTLDSPMLIEVELALDGTDVRDGMRVWRAIETAVYGKLGDPNAQAVALANLYSVGISSADVILPAFGLDQTTAVQVRQRSKGLIRLRLYIPCGG